MPSHGLNPVENVYVVATVADLPDVLSRFVIYNLLYDPGAGVGLYYTSDGSALIRLDPAAVAEVNDLTAAVTWANVPDANITVGSVTQHVGSIDHNLLLNHLAAEHVDWAGAGAGVIHTDNYVENATHTGQVTGSGALALAISAITAQPASGALIGTDTLIVNDGGVLSECTLDQVSTFVGLGSGEINDLTAAVVWANVPDANVTVGSVTQHVAAINHNLLLNYLASEHFTEASITLLETQITDGAVLARVAGNEAISGAWVFSHVGGVILESTLPKIVFDDTNAAAGQGVFTISGDNETLGFGVTTDDRVTTSNAILIERTSQTIDKVSLLGSEFRSLTSINRFDNPVFIAESAAAGTGAASLGQFWVRNDVPNTPMFTDDAGGDHVLNGSSIITDVFGRTGAIVALTGDYAAFYTRPGDAEAISGAWVFSNTGGLILESTLPKIIFDDTNAAANQGVFTISGDNETLAIQVTDDARTSSATALLIERTGQTIDKVSLFGSEFRSLTSLNRFDNPVYIAESAAASGNTASLGQYWVRNDVPNTPMFTDDAGGDHVLNVGEANVVDSVFSRTGVVVAVTGDYAAFYPEISGAESISGVWKFTNTGGLILESTLPKLIFDDTNAAAGQGVFTISGDNETLGFGITTDNHVTTSNAILIERTSQTIDKVSIFGAEFRSLASLNRIDTPLFIAESAAASDDVAALGQFWVFNDVPNLPMFTGDTGDDAHLHSGMSDINTQNVNYTLVMGDLGKTIYKASGGVGETLTIPANSSVAFPIGAMVGFDNDGGGDLTIAITTDVLVGTDGVTGSRTLGDNEIALIHKITATRWRYHASDL